MGILEGILRNVNVGMATKTFMVLSARKKVDQYLRILGPRRIKVMIEQGQDLSGILDEMLTPEQQTQIRDQVSKYSWINDVFTDEDMVSTIPPWAMAVINHHGPAGRDWLDRQIAWVRQVLTSG